MSKKFKNKRKVIPSANIPLVQNPNVPDVKEYNDWDWAPVQYYTYQKSKPKVDPKHKLFLEKQLVAHYIETIPEDCKKKIIYIMQGDGLYEKRINRIGTFITKISDVTIPGLKSELIEGWELNTPKIPASYLGTIVSFFRKICNKYSSEVFLQLFYDFSKEDWLLHCPKQTISGASVNYTNDEICEDQDKVLVFEIHSHVNMNAFFSGTDDGDEKADRFYGVIGKVSQYFPEIKLRVMMGGRASDVEVDDIFDTEEEMYHIENYPKDWINNIKENKFVHPNYMAHRSYNTPYVSPHQEDLFPNINGELTEKFMDKDHLFSHNEFMPEEDTGYWIRENGIEWYVEGGRKIYYKDPDDGQLYYPLNEDDMDDDLEEELDIVDYRGVKF